MYCPGNPGDINTVLSKCLKPVHLLHLMANANIATSKVNQLLQSQDTNAKTRALDSFDSKDVRDILLELDKYVAHNLVVYVLHDHDRDGLSHIQTS